MTAGWVVIALSITSTVMVGSMMLLLFTWFYARHRHGVSLRDYMHQLRPTESSHKFMISTGSLVSLDVSPTECMSISPVQPSLTLLEPHPPPSAHRHSAPEIPHLHDIRSPVGPYQHHKSSPNILRSPEVSKPQLTTTSERTSSGKRGSFHCLLPSEQVAGTSRRGSIHSLTPSEPASPSRRRSSLLSVVNFLEKEFGLGIRPGVSYESLNSAATSVSIGAEESGLGELEIGLHHDSARDQLRVSVIQAESVPAIELDSSATKTLLPSTFVSVRAYPGDCIPAQTKVQLNTRAPYFNEDFFFRMSSSQLEIGALHIQLWRENKRSKTHRKKLSAAPELQIFLTEAAGDTQVLHNPEEGEDVSSSEENEPPACEGKRWSVLAEAEIKLTDLQLQRPCHFWLSMSEPHKVERRHHVGEILFSLTYLPTAERLTVVIIKTADLCWTDKKRFGDGFVKVCLTKNKRKVSKKRTSLIRCETSPVFNEAMVFSVPRDKLQEIEIYITVVEQLEDERHIPIGHVVAGAQSAGRAPLHWSQMLACVRRPVAMWHVLHGDVASRDPSPLLSGQGSEAEETDPADDKMKIEIEYDSGELK